MFKTCNFKIFFAVCAFFFRGSLDCMDDRSRSSLSSTLGSFDQGLGRLQGLPRAFNTGVAYARESNHAALVALDEKEQEEKTLQSKVNEYEEERKKANPTISLLKMELDGTPLAVHGNLKPESQPKDPMMQIHSLEHAIAQFPKDLENLQTKLKSLEDYYKQSPRYKAWEKAKKDFDEFVNQDLLAKAKAKLEELKSPQAPAVKVQESRVPARPATPRQVPPENPEAKKLREKAVELREKAAELREKAAASEQLIKKSPLPMEGNRNPTVFDQERITAIQGGIDYLIERAEQLVAKARALEQEAGRVAVVAAPAQIATPASRPTAAPTPAPEKPSQDFPAVNSADRVVSLLESALEQREAFDAAEALRSATPARRPPTPTPTTGPARPATPALRPAVSIQPTLGAPGRRPASAFAKAFTSATTTADRPAAPSKKGLLDQARNWWHSDKEIRGDQRRQYEAFKAKVKAKMKEVKQQLNRIPLGYDIEGTVEAYEKYCASLISNRDKMYRGESEESFRKRMFEKLKGSEEFVLTDSDFDFFANGVGGLRPQGEYQMNLVKYYELWKAYIRVKVLLSLKAKNSYGPEESNPALKPFELQKLASECQAGVREKVLYTAQFLIRELKRMVEADVKKDF